MDDENGGILGSIEDGVSNVFGESSGAASGIAGAGGTFASDITNATSNLFSSISSTFSDNPDALTYVSYGAMAIGAYLLFNKIFGGSKRRR